MAGSMKDIKLRIKSVESTMQITKAMELVASSKMRRAKERVEHSRPYFETLYKTLTEIAAADPRARNPYLRRSEIKRTLLVVIAGDRGLAGGYNANVLKLAAQESGNVEVLPIGKRSAEYFAHHEAELFTQEVLLAADISVGQCFQLARQITEGYRKGEFDAVKLCYTRFDSMMTQTAVSIEVLPLAMEPTEQQKAEAGITDPQNAVLPKPEDLEALDASPVRTLDKTAEQQMIARIDEAKENADTLGGVIEVVVYGVPAGIGTYVESDRRLDAALASAVMGVQAIKGVEIGDGFLEAMRPGSQAHDEMVVGDDGRITRLSNRAGGIEGGMSNGQPIVVRAAMKPIPSIPKALRTVDVTTGEATQAINQRSDNTAVPAAAVVAEAMVRLTIAQYVLEKFGGDSVAETKRNAESYVASWPEHMR